MAAEECGGSRLTRSTSLSRGGACRSAQNVALGAQVLSTALEEQLRTSQGAVAADVVQPPLQRASSWCEAACRRDTCPEVSEHSRRLSVPGGFRRDRLRAAAEWGGVRWQRRPDAWPRSLTDTLQGEPKFEGAAGEAGLWEASYGLPRQDADGRPLPEERQRLARGLSSTGVAIAVFKGNIGSNILYMPHAWQQGGYMVGAVAVPLLAALSVLCIVRLIRCREGNVQSYGDLVERATNRQGRVAVETCVVLLQVGTCCAYLINVSQVLRRIAFPHAGTAVLILCEAALISPLVLIRNIAKLNPVNMMAGGIVVMSIAAAFLLLGRHLGTSGAAEVQPFSGSGFLVCVGIACFAFEGIGLVIPIYDSCRYPNHFACVYGFTIAAVVLLICAMAVLGYLAFGAATSTLVLLNLPPGPLTSAIQVAFSAVMLASFPLQLLPAIRIVEGLFLHPSRPLTRDKHVKSAFRVGFVALVAGVSILGSTSLDHFVSLIGAVCGLPLAFIFPAICHRNLVAEPWSRASLVDAALVMFGALVTVSVGAENVLTWGA